MANCQNIQPYSNMAHLMAQYGRPDLFVKCVLRKGYQMGVRNERKTELWKIPLAVGLGFVICKANDLVQNRWKAYKKEKVCQQTDCNNERTELQDKTIMEEKSSSTTNTEMVDNPQKIL